MAFKTVQDLDAETVTALGGKDKKTGKKNPTTAEGFYLGFRKVVSKKSKTGFSNIYYLQTPEGNLGIWGKTNLDRKMVSVQPGVMIRITQSGMKETEYGPMFLFKVEQDLENTIEVSVASDNSSTEVESEGTDSTYEDEDSDEDNDGDSDEALEASAAASAARRAQSAALLNKGKSKVG